MAHKEPSTRPSRGYGPAERARTPGAAAEAASSLPEIVRIAAWRRWYFIIAFGVGTALTLASSLYWPRKYTARCIIERYDDLTLSTSVSANSPFGFLDYRQALPVELQGFEAAKRAIEQIDLTKGLPRDSRNALTDESQRRLQQLAEAVAKEIDLAFLQKSDRLDLIEISFTWSDPGIAQRLLAKLKDNYIEGTLALIRERMQKAESFFEQEEKRYADDLRKAEKTLDDIKVEVGGNPSSPGFLEGERSKLEAERAMLLQKKRENDRTLNNSKKSLSDINGMLAGGTTQPTASAPATEPNDAVALVAQLEKEVRDLNDAIDNNATFRKMRPEHPDQQALVKKRDRKKEQLAKMKQEVTLTLTSAPVLGPSFDRQALLLERQRLENYIGLLQELNDDTVGDINNVERLIEVCEKKKPALVEAQQKWRIGEEVYKQAFTEHKRWQDLRGQVKRFLSAEVSNRGIQLTTKEEPQPVLKASSPTFAWVIIVALVVGAGAGVGAVVLSEFFDRSYRTATQVAKSLALPILESIDEVVTPQTKWRRFMQRAVVMPSVTVVLILLVACTASMAYLSLELPQFYQAVRASPRSALEDLLRTLGRR
jgi:uncharacterized protein involved in exopolysaccharide biosynthesis